MHTISALARNAALPRRSVQYWHDQSIIIPISRSPVVYSDEELLLVRLLAPFDHLSCAVGAIRELARIFRLCLSRDGSVPPDVAQAFSNARDGDEGYFMMAPEMIGTNRSDPKSFWIWTAGAVSKSQAAKSIFSLNYNARANLAVVMIDLQYALNSSVTVGAIREDEE
ncbi:hypothetical protein J5J86_20780 [Aquabacter sp. L1I39]|uniref:hypothetical protein n=1 Tax=Aquabacter sp. L1I39 TaxID=2820278 RepID=UPI001AD9B85F|nr:hypothetical protein [Aquabacter sp. L1I39]QTL03161.1 hypothetical protein J5J86_20780 [Aquabacter sp. L1I39]